jgi:hypothetical protein
MANMRPYDVAISNAIEKNDARKLEKYIQQAKDLHAQQGGDLSKAIKKGEAALKKLQKGGGYSASTSGSKAKGKK